ncbi:MULTISPECIES: hypothetical protein [unclassified Streptomyces]|uniref:hypothetical protein n=1 Tax=unclassified Streptomyces TaxID=2593676 RepID=UPI0016613D8D|nr:MULTISPECIES: hypothetical protein [unclassified Streptomyces]MBD0707393.1 hypothetical protein [Streptomyces sp. CBMA291]MBD0715155.1 hypothetical protein [Streptomyces sp. CBMA370]
MARARFIGPEPVTVPELGDRLVHPDEVITVPDHRYEGYVCQTITWSPVEEPGAPKKTAAKTAMPKEN